MEISIKKYYDINWKKIDHNISVEKAKEQFKELFYTSVQRRLRSDVTVGSSLSGGLDSSLVVSVIDELKKGSNQKQNTFSAVFPGFKKDERKFIDCVISQTNVNPYFVIPDEQGFIKDFEKLCWHHEEPYVSSSIYAQYCVMQLAKQNNTTVLLDGQGADEVLAGYHSYYASYFRGIKDSKGFKNQLTKYNELYSNNPISNNIKSDFGEIVKGISPSLLKPAKQLRNLYNQIISPTLNKDFFNQYKKEVFDTSNNNFNSLNEYLYHSTMKVGLQQLLRYADRNSMAHGREVRLPFLSHELVEFLFSLPETYKINEGWTKWIMRTTFENTMPKEIAWRRDKIGYEAPQQSWMENETVKEVIKSNIVRLIDKHFLDPRVSNNFSKTEKVHGANNNDWKQLMAGNIV